MLTACPNCQGKVSDQVAVCPHCGAPLLKPVPCRVCHNPIPAGETTCPTCNAQIGGPVSHGASAPPSASQPVASAPTPAPVGLISDIQKPSEPVPEPPKAPRGIPPVVKTAAIALAAVVGLIVLGLGTFFVVRKTDEQCKRETRCEQAGLCSATFQSCVAATSSDCSKSQNCREYGECSARDGKCVVASEADCAAICKTSDRCVAQNGRCICDPKRSTSCIDVGKCGVDDRGWCTNFTEEGCKQSTKCATDGLCSLAPEKDKCSAAGNDNCASSEACKKEGRCEAKDGVCVRIDCRTSEDCTAKGRCTSASGKCVASTNEDCAASAWCKNLGRCAASDGKCRATEEGCKASQKCKDDGACFVSKDGEACVTKKALEASGG